MHENPAAVRAEAVVDLAAITANVRLLLAQARATAPVAELMAVVKADGYGHGAAPAARAAQAGGAAWLGVATPTEALALRAAGVTGPIAAWLWLPQEPIGPALAAGVTVVVSSREHLDAVMSAAASGPAGAAPPAVHLKVDTGLSRNGVPLADAGPLVAALAAAHRAGRVAWTGLMSHLASADVPDDPSVAEQTAAYRAAERLVADAGIRVRWRHLANTPGTLDHPDTVFDLVRCGIGIYGIDPTAGTSATARALRPAMSLRARVALVKYVPAGAGASYGLTWRAPAATTVALVPVGYADGIPRAASSAGQVPVVEVLVGGRRRPVVGRVAMDQVVLDIGGGGLDPVRIGDEVLLFGPGDAGEPTANEWGERTGTIGYEIVTRIGPRVPRRYVGHPDQREGTP